MLFYEIISEKMRSKKKQLFDHSAKNKTLLKDNILSTRTFSKSRGNLRDTFEKPRGSQA